MPKDKLPISKDTLDNFSNMFRKATKQPSLEEDQERQARLEALKKIVKSQGEK